MFTFSLLATSPVSNYYYFNTEFLTRQRVTCLVTCFFMYLLRSSRSRVSEEAYSRGIQSRSLIARELRDALVRLFGRNYLLLSAFFVSLRFSDPNFPDRCSLSSSDITSPAAATFICFSFFR